MKKVLCILISLYLYNYCHSQIREDIQIPVKIYHNNEKRVMNIPFYDSLLLSGEYEKSIINNIKIVNDTTLKHFQVSYAIYMISIANILLGKIDSAYYYLDKFVNTSFDDRVIFVDRNLDTLKHYSDRWNSLVNKVEQKFVENIGVIKDTNLAIRLFYLGIEDQKYRTILSFLRQYTEEDNYKAVTSHYALQDSCMNIINQYGVPTISMVGQFASNKFFLLIQHSEPKTQDKYYKLVKKAWKKGDFDSISYAMLTDRVLMGKKKKQIYGTQLIKRSNDKKYPNQLYLYPVKDFKNLNKRRKKIGFTETIEDWIKRQPEAFIPKEYYE